MICVTAMAGAVAYNREPAAYCIVDGVGVYDGCVVCSFYFDHLVFLYVLGMFVRILL